MDNDTTEDISDIELDICTQRPHRVSPSDVTSDLASVDWSDVTYLCLATPTSHFNDVMPWLWSDPLTSKSILIKILRSLLLQIFMTNASH